jgi:acetyl-CoA carboxylase carboxyl transferase subunit alpha
MGNMAVERPRTLQFEYPLLSLEEKIETLKQQGFSPQSREIRKLDETLCELEERIYKNLSSWEEVQLARHLDRPTMMQYVNLIFDDFYELHGDRVYRDDPAIIGGIASIGEIRLMIIGQEKGRNTNDRLKHNFGMANPEGFRKSLRLMKTAEKFSLPILSLVDTPGAYPGVGAEERGQPGAIASNLKEVFGIRTPIVVVILGEGGSGGALALGIGDRVMMMKHSIYSVISPEGCAAILWKDKSKAMEAASSLRLTSKDCLELKVVDVVIEEIHGAAHRDPEGNAMELKKRIIEQLNILSSISTDILLEERVKKFTSFGEFNVEQ